jgi:hypothetical protein
VGDGGGLDELRPVPDDRQDPHVNPAPAAGIETEWSLPSGGRRARSCEARATCSGT